MQYSCKMLLFQGTLSQTYLSFIKTELYIIKENRLKTWKEKCHAKMNCDIDFLRINGFCNIKIKKPLLH